jgi:hypothetical protein
MATILDSLDDFQDQPLTDREREFVHTLRVMLKDLPDDVFRSLNTLVEEQRGERWSDMQLLVYLNNAVADINVEPPHTIYSFENFPMQYKMCVLNGAMIFALIAEGIFQQGCFMIFKISFLLKKLISFCII